MRPFALVGCSLKTLVALIALCSAVLLLCASGAQAQITVSPASSTLSFGIPTGSSPAVSVPENVTIAVTSGAVTFSSPAWTLTPSPGPFSVTGDTCSGNTLVAPATCQISVTFSSTSSTLQTATLSLSPAQVPEGVFQLPTISLSGAYGAIKLWDETTVQPSVLGAFFTSLYTIANANLNLSCPAGVPLSVILSGTPDGLGNVMADNYITLGVSFPPNPAFPPAPVSTYLSENGYSALYPNQVNLESPPPFAYPLGNICQGSDAYPDTNTVSVNGALVTNTYPECFTAAYRSDVTNLVGDYTDTLANANGIIPSVGDGTAGGVSFLNISQFFQPGSQLASFSALDAGGYYETSTLFLVTDCAQAGLVPGGSVSGSPIVTSPVQTLTLDGSSGQLAAVTINNTGATVTDNPSPLATDFAISQTAFASLVAGTSAAPSVCLRWTAELGAPDGNGQLYQCKGVQVQCTDPISGRTSGNNCGTATSRILLDYAQFDSPDTPLPATVLNTLFTSCGYYLSLPPNPIGGGTCAASGPYGPNPTQLIGPGFLMFGDSPSGAVCPLGPPFNVGYCPVNTLTETQPGLDNGMGGGTAPARQSIFVAVVNMPLPFSNKVAVSGGTDTPSANGWVNSDQVTASLTSNEATYSGTSTNPPSNGFVAAPPYFVSYLFAPASQPIPDTTYPLPGATINYNANTNPSFATPFCNVGGNATPTSFQTVADYTAPADGLYNFIYQTTSCDLTEELWLNPSPLTIKNPAANWASFPVLPFGVDTMPPTETCSFSPASPNGTNGWYTSTVTESCSAADADYFFGKSGSGFPPLQAGSIQGTSPQCFNGTAPGCLAPPLALNSTGTFPTQQTQDLAGNLSNAVVSPLFPIDEANPTITCSFTPSAACGSNPTFFVGQQSVSVSYTCADAISGIGNCAGTAPAPCPAAPSAGTTPFSFASPISTAIGQLGAHSSNVSATDCAGNSSSTLESYTVAYAPAKVVFGQLPVLIPIAKTSLQAYVLAAVDENPATSPYPVYGSDMTATLTFASGTLVSGTATAFVADVTCTSFPCTAMPPSGSACSVTPSSVSSSTTSVTVNCNAGTINDLYTAKTGAVVVLELPISSKACGKTITGSGSITAASPISGTTSFTKQAVLIP